MTIWRDRAQETIGLSPREARSIIRRGEWSDLTEAVAQSFVHLAPVILPAQDIEDFVGYCAANPQAAPLVRRLTRGSWTTELAPDADIRTDVVRYQIWLGGELADEVADLRPFWRDDLVTLLLGTSHILGAPLKEGGISAETVDNPRPAIYRTALPTVPFGRLAGPLFVTVKFADLESVDLIKRISARLPAGHGAPIHAGDPDAIGVDGAHPAFGYPLEVPSGRVPVFWACGFSALAALRSARTKWFACHAPGCTFITDLPWRSLLTEG